MKTPWLTMALASIAGLLHLLPEAIRSSLYFDKAQLAQGNPLGLFTGHWLHGDGEHLLWNVAGLLVLGGLIEQFSRRHLAVGLVAGTLAVNMLLLAPWLELQRYCGLSGVLNTLLVIALLHLWHTSRSLVIPLIGLLSLGKIFIEMQAGVALFTHTAWPPFAAAHLAGVIGGGIVLWWAGSQKHAPSSA
ncbi:MAG: rhombosortase [Pseudomonadota bacterium]